MKKLFLLLILISTLTTNAQIPSTLGEISSSFTLDYTQTSGRMIGSWLGRQNMPHPRYYGGSAAFTEGDTTWLYIFGGDTSGYGDSVQTALRYNLISNTWEYTDSLPEPMRNNAAAQLGNKLYTMGGFAGPNPDSALKTFLAYDINTKSWQYLPDLPEGIIFHRAFGYQDSLIYILGGVTYDSIYYRNNVLVYNINSQTFRNASPLPEPRANFALVVKGNTFYIAGGFYDNDSISNKTIIGTINPLNHSSITYSVLTDSASLYPLPVHANYGYPYGPDKINFFGGSRTRYFNPVNNSYVLNLPQNIFSVDSIAEVPFSLMAFHSGYVYTPKPGGTDSVLKVVVAGGVQQGMIMSSGTWVYTDSNTVTNIISENNLPEGFSLEQNFPNPFNPSTTIRFSIPENSFVKLEVFNINGEKISTLVSQFLPAGNYAYQFNVSELKRSISSGTYFYRLIAGEFSETKKFLLLK